MHKVDRLDFVDNAKALAILLVLIAHTDGITEPFRRFVFSFHMPVFFFLSGLLLKDSRLALSPHKFLNGQVKSLLVPFLFFAVLSQIYEIPRLFLKKQDLNLTADLTGILWGNADGLANTVLWFFTCLFSTSVIYYCVSKILSGFRLLLLTLAAALVATYFYHPSMQRLPWNLDLSVVAVSFYALGKYVADNGTARYAIGPTLLQKLSMFAIGTSILFYLTTIAGRVDMAFMAFGNPFLFLVDGVLGIFLVLIGSSLIPSNRVTAFLSRNTIVIFPLHPIFFSVFSGIAIIVFKAQSNFDASWLWSLLFTAGAVALSYPASMFLFSYCPFFLGGRRVEKATSSH